jgi:hypothetical protein
MRVPTWLLVTGVVGFAASCAENEPGGSVGGCRAGDTRTCVGQGACAGGQLCGSNGAWGSCECAGTPTPISDASVDGDTSMPPGSAGSSGDGGLTEGGADSASDGGTFTGNITGWRQTTPVLPGGLLLLFSGADGYIYAHSAYSAYEETDNLAYVTAVQGDGSLAPWEPVDATYAPIAGYSGRVFTFLGDVDEPQTIRSAALNSGALAAWSEPVAVAPPNSGVVDGGLSLWGLDGFPLPWVTRGNRLFAPARGPDQTNPLAMAPQIATTTIENGSVGTWKLSLRVPASGSGYDFTECRGRLYSRTSATSFWSAPIAADGTITDWKADTAPTMEACGTDDSMRIDCNGSYLISVSANYNVCTALVGSNGVVSTWQAQEPHICTGGCVGLVVMEHHIYLLGQTGTSYVADLR